MSRDLTAAIFEDDRITIAAGNIRVVIKHNDIGVSVDYYSENGSSPFREDQVLFEDADKDDEDGGRQV